MHIIFGQIRVESNLLLGDDLGNISLSFHSIAQPPNSLGNTQITSEEKTTLFNRVTRQ